MDTTYNLLGDNLTRLIDSKKIMKESRVVISQEVREIIGVCPGDYVSFIEDEEKVYITKTEV
ncbi:hypothetical protein TALC_00364 [Thermoplasmatales archaeon BRNA1]|nr:hypothetical protein TALC_00364 [Thermoplasmatales archaeon BRNA1]